jgi:regulator of sigma E protease
MSIAGLSLEQLAILPISIVAFVILLTVIVFFHEFGHFSVARLFGVRVEVFSIGFGKTLLRWTDRSGTEWRISLIPLGGYVKFFGDANEASAPREDVASDRASEKDGPATTQFPRPGDAPSRPMTAAERRVCFHFKPVGVRAAIVAAGPIANFILATAIFWGLLMAFGKFVREPLIADVLAGSAAAEAGLIAGDRVVSINGRPVADFDDLSLTVKVSAGEKLRLEIDRSGERLTVIATPRREEMTDGFGNPVSVGKLGIVGNPNAVTFKRYGPGAALAASVQQVWDILRTTVKYLSRLVVGKEDARQLGGPLKMAQYAGQSVMSGFDESGYSQRPDFLTMLKVSVATFVNLAAVVSVSIGFLNLLPVPVLDGGHLMYYAYEAVARRPLGPRAQAIGFRVGLALLASLMLFVTWNDISNILSIAG